MKFWRDAVSSKKWLDCDGDPYHTTLGWGCGWGLQMSWRKFALARCSCFGFVWVIHGFINSVAVSYDRMAL